MRRNIPSVLLLLALAGTTRAGWLPEERLTIRPDTGDFTSLNNARCVAADPAGNVHVVWYGRSGAQSQVWYTRWDAQAGVWSRDTVVSGVVGTASFPSLVADDSGNVHVVWQTLGSDTAICYRCRSWRSGEWSAVETVVTGNATGQPSIAARRPCFVAVVWQQVSPGQNYNVFASFRDSSGWHVPETVSVPMTSGQGYPSVGVDADSGVQVAWQSSGARLILFRERVGAGWAKPDTLSHGSQCSYPCLWSGTDGTAHVLWLVSSSSSNRHLVYRQRRWGVWSDSVVLPRVRGRQRPGSISGDESGFLHVVSMVEDPVDLYYVDSDSTGSNWSQPLLLASGANDRRNPSVCCGPGSCLHVVWTDFRHHPSYPDIYCRRKGVLRDIEAKRIVSPSGVVDSGAAVAPAAWIANQGESTEVQVRVWFKMGGSVSEQGVEQVLAGDSAFVEFDTCVASVPGLVPLCCSTALAGDVNRANDVVRDSFFVRLRDVALDSVLSPVGLLPLDTVRPRVLVRNRGNITDTVMLRFYIKQGSATRHSDSLARTLLPGGVVTAVFRPWPGTTGVFTASCTLACTGDIHPENDTASAAFELYWRDVRVESIIWPPAQVDSGKQDSCLIRVSNSGTKADSFVSFITIGSDFSDSLAVTGLGPGCDSTLSLRPWTARARGWHPVTCSLRCPDDMDPGNNTLTCSTFVEVRDVAAESILTPSGMSRADSVKPRALVRNHGNTLAQFRSVFCIESETSDTVYVGTVETELEPGRDSVVGFASWLGEPGQYRASCKTALADDMRAENDTVSTLFSLYRLDVQVVSLVSPPALIDSGWSGQPAVQLRNLSPVPMSCVCSLYIGPYYGRNDTVEGLPPGESLDVRFPEAYYALERGWQPVLCSILGVTGPSGKAGTVPGLPEAGRNPVQSLFFPELHPHPLPPPSRGREQKGGGWDLGYVPLRLPCSVFVRVRDASADTILVPVGNVGRGELRPRVQVANRGNVPGEVRCWFTIGDSTEVPYRDSVSAPMAPESDTVLEFSAWQAQSGRYWAQAWTVLDSDAVRTNDTARADFHVLRMDVALQRIEQPTGRAAPGTVVPEAVVENLGDADAVVMVSMAITGAAPAYEDTVWSLPVPRGTKTVAAFRQWQAEVGEYRVFSRVVVVGDEDPENDTCSATVCVESIVSRRWSRLADVPLGPRSKSVKDGGSVTVLPDGLFCLKGGNSDESYRYFLNGDSWVACAAVPCDSGSRKVKSGAALCSDGAGHVFALKGGRTREFLSYDVTKDSWSFLPELPAGTRLVKYGAGLAFIAGDTGRVFFIKGSGTRDFLVYWVGPKQWHARRWLPLGQSGRPARRGTCLAALAGRIFCLKGGTNEFYEYVVAKDSWAQRADLPKSSASGRSGRTGRGAALCPGPDGCLLAFKGRGNEFWRYDPARDSWDQCEDMPRGLSGRKVGRGGALAWLAGKAYALKGNGTRELWCYDPAAPAPGAGHNPIAGDCHPVSSEETGGCTSLPRLGLCPKPVRSPCVVYDAAGRLVHCSLSASGEPVLSALRPGVYLLASRTGRVRKVVKVR